MHGEVVVGHCELLEGAISLGLKNDGVVGLPCIRQAKLVLRRLRIVMTVQKMRFVIVLAMEGVVLGSGFEMRVRCRSCYGLEDGTLVLVSLTCQW